MLRTGSEEWWQTLRGPQCRAVDGAIEVTFWWRDPAGDETCSPHRRVWLYITGVTDHHQNARPQSLQRLPGTDAWFWRTTLSPTWRGSYCFIPSDRDDDFSPEVFSADAPDRALLREGWRKLLPRAIADPLNPHSWRGGRGHGVSALEMPQAPAQPGWDPLNEAHPAARCLEWRSARLGNHRRVWIYTTGEAVDPQTRPLAILLDGQFWAESMPVWSPLAALTREGRLPPAVYLLIDAIDNQHRAHELPCQCGFLAGGTAKSYYRWSKAIAPFSDRGDRTVVAGQSFGGLSALYTGLRWPERFGCVLSQSGIVLVAASGRPRQGERVIVEQLKAMVRCTPKVCASVLEAGIREPMIMQANQALYAQLHPNIKVDFLASG
ncbi:enterochelin esterase [Escherichia coli]|nr:enterochelin esterase [Escherichia coli]